MDIFEDLSQEVRSFQECVLLEKRLFTRGAPYRVEELRGPECKRKELTGEDVARKMLTIWLEKNGDKTWEQKKKMVSDAISKIGDSKKKLLFEQFERLMQGED